MVTQPTLFDAGDDPSPPPPPAETLQLPVEPWLVAELVVLGVGKETAQGYSLKQAFAIRAKLQRAGGTKAKRGEKPDPDAEQVHRDGPDAPPKDRGVSALERSIVADLLRATVEDHRDGRVSGDDVYRALRASLYVLTADELDRVAIGLANLLGEING